MLLGVILVYNILAPSMMVLVLFDSDSLAALIAGLAFILWMLMYPVMAIAATCIFQRKLLALAKKQAASTTNVTKMVELNRRQKTLIAVAAYVLCGTFPLLLTEHLQLLLI